MKETMPKSSAAPVRIPLCKPYMSEAEERAAAEVLRSGWLMQGPKVAEFERLISEYVGTKHAVAVNSGTSALALALVAAGLNPGDRVIMPSHSFVATANSAAQWGGEPVFVDIGRNDYNIDPSKIRPAADSMTRAVMVVHQVGFAADMDPIMSIAEELGLVVVEDAACSLGSSYRGRKTGGIGTVGCLSLHPRKVITTGEGGMVLTDSEEIAQKVRSLRNHGLTPAGASERPGCDRAGFNYRLTDIQAAIGIEQFKKLDEIIRLRTRLAERYRDAISRLPALRLPEWPDDSVPNYQSFVAEVIDESIDRDAIVEHMMKKGIQCARGIQPIHLEPLYREKHSGERLPETLRAARRSFFLPMYPAMTDEEQDVVIGSLKESLNECALAKEAR